MKTNIHSELMQIIKRFPGETKIICFFQSITRTPRGEVHRHFMYGHTNWLQYPVGVLERKAVVLKVPC